MVRDSLRVSEQRHAAIVAACVEAANQIAADQQRRAEAARHATAAVRRRYESILATIEAQGRLPIMAGMAAGISLPLTVREAPPKRREELEDVGPVTSFDQALYLLSRGWKPGSVNPAPV